MGYLQGICACMLYAYYVMHIICHILWHDMPDTIVLSGDIGYLLSL